MEIFGRRRATPEELAQGEKEMREEQERLKKERMSEFLEQQDAAVARSLVFEERPQATIEDQGEEESMEKILQEQSALQEQLRGREVAEEISEQKPRGPEAVSPGPVQPLFDVIS